MNESVDSPATATPQAATRSAGTQPLLTLIRREFWEHRALWVAPLAVSALLIVSAIFGRANFPSGTGLSALNLPGPTAIQAAVVAGVVIGFGFTQYITMSIVLWFYTADCLYGERRDRSILFWKSMPVSDAQTVASKALVALLVVPLGVYLVTAVTSLVGLGILSIRGFTVSAPPTFWDSSSWLHAEGYSLVWLVLSVLWYAPLTAYLMVVSAWARRSVQIWAILPPIIAILIERIGFGTHYLSTWVLYRLGPSWQAQSEQWIERLFSGPAFYSSGGAAATQPAFAGGPGALSGFGNVDLWIGLAVAIALFYVAMRIRRYRDDT
jgi:ABC-2 type transport system permease protein